MMTPLNSKETRFLCVFLHEATTAPFTGPATKALHEKGLEYGDISYLVWAYEQDVPRTGFAMGTPRTRRRSPGRTDIRRWNETRKLSEFGGNDAKRARFQ